MKKLSKIKKVFLGLFSALFMGCIATSVALVTPTASADTDYTITEQDPSTYQVLGMSVRIQKPEGLRFVAQMKTTEKQTYDLKDGRYGMLLIPTSKLGDANMGIEPVFDANDNLVDFKTVTTTDDGTSEENPNILRIQTKVWMEESTAQANGIDTTNYSAFSSVLAKKDSSGNYLDFPEDYYNMAFTARAYVAYLADDPTVDNNGDKNVDLNDKYIIEYSKTQVTRSLGYVSFVSLGADNYLDTRDQIYDRSGGTSTVTDANPISGNQSLKLETSDSGAEVNFCSMLGVKFFPTADVRYYAQLKLRVNSITGLVDGATPRIAVRLQDETVDPVVVTEGLHLYMTADGKVDTSKVDQDGAGNDLPAGIVGNSFAPSDSDTTYLYDEETNVITIQAYFTAATANQIFSLTTVGGNKDANGQSVAGSRWNITIDEFSIKQAGKTGNLFGHDFEGLDVGKRIQDAYMNLVDRSGIQRVLTSDPAADTDGDGYLDGTAHGTLTGTLTVENPYCDCGFEGCDGIGNNGAAGTLYYTPTFTIAGVDAFTSDYVQVTYGCLEDEKMVYFEATNREKFRLDATAEMMMAAIGAVDGEITLQAWATVGRDADAADGTKDLWWSEFSTTCTIEVVTTMATYTPTNAVQAAGGSVTLQFNSNKRPFRLYAEDGKTVLLTVEKGAYVSQNGISYNSDGTITLTNEYLSTLSAGLHHITAKVCDAAHSEIKMGFTVYGDENGKHISFPSIVSSTDMDWFADSSSFGTNAQGESVLQLVNDTTNTTSCEIVDEGNGAIAGKSLKVSTTLLEGANTSSVWEEIIELDYGFKYGVTYEIGLKMKWEMPDAAKAVNGGKGASIVWAFDANTAGFGVNTVENNSCWHADRGSTPSTYSTDTTTGVTTFHMILTPYAQDDELLSLMIAGGDATQTRGNWVIYIDDISIMEYAVYNTTNQYSQTFPKDTYAAGTEFTMDGGNLFTAGANGTIVAGSTGGYALQLKTATETKDGGTVASNDAEWNRMMASRLTTSQTGSGVVAGQRYLIHLKFTYQVPDFWDPDTTGVIAIRFLEEVNGKTVSAVDGLFISVSKQSNTLNRKSDDDTFYMYDKHSGVISAYVYMTATSSNQQLNLTTVSNKNKMQDTDGDDVVDYGQWTITVDDLSVVKLREDPYMHFNGNNITMTPDATGTSDTVTVNGNTVENTAQNIFAGQPVHFTYTEGSPTTSISDGGLYYSTYLQSNFWSVTGANETDGAGATSMANAWLIWVDNVPANTKYRITLRLSVAASTHNATSDKIENLFFHTAGANKGIYIKNNELVNSADHATDYSLSMYEVSTDNYLYTWSFVFTTGDTVEQWVLWDYAYQKFGIFEISVVPIGAA
ncbi:MAG: hypothetical protein IJY11_02645 [Clostridia bacterium]|nr:hypothetical protein [Clostridia bacterium]